MCPEPVLSAEDEELWAYWRKVALVHADTKAFARKVRSAKEVAASWLDRCERPAVSWSGGKDSTCMTHLICCEMGARGVHVFSEKDDLDYPGEEQYVTGLADEWGIEVTILRPAVSPSAWLSARAGQFSAGDDMHGRRSGLSRECFYGLVDAHGALFDGLALGIRSEESDDRMRLRKARGSLYVTKAGQLRALPISDWTGLDVLAYSNSRDIQLLPVYRCIALMHSREPWRVRKSWWLPTSHAARYGSVAWLKRYWPSLFDRFESLFWDAALHT